MWDLSSLTWDWTRVPAVKAWSLNHWTTGEVPPWCFYPIDFAFVVPRAGSVFWAFWQAFPMGIEHRASIPNVIERHQRRLPGEESVCRLRLNRTGIQIGCHHLWLVFLTSLAEWGVPLLYSLNSGSNPYSSKHICNCWIDNTYQYLVGFLGDSVVKNLPANAGDSGSIPGSGRYLGGGNGNPLQYSCLGNPMDRGAWWAIVHGVIKSRTWPSMHTMGQWQYLVIACRLVIVSVGLWSLWEKGTYRFTFISISEERSCHGKPLVNVCRFQDGWRCGWMDDQ